MRFRSSFNLSVLLEKSPFNIIHSRSDIEWTGLLKCLATGCPLLLSRILNAESKDGITYVVVSVTFLAFI